MITEYMYDETIIRLLPKPIWMLKKQWSNVKPDHCLVWTIIRNAMVGG